MAAPAQTANHGPATEVGAYPKVRRMRFRFDDPVPMAHHFMQGDIALSHLVALLSASFPPGEESFIRSVRRFADQITDPELKQRVTGFIGQEAVHGQQHRVLNDKLAMMGYPLVRAISFGPGSSRQRRMVQVENLLPRHVHLAITAAAEHYTATLAERILSDEELRAIPGDPEVWHLLDWHAFEELEHKAVAFDVYRSVGGPESVRIAVMAVLWVSMIPLMTVAVAASILTDPPGRRPITATRQGVGIFRGPLLRGLMSDLAVYLKPGFHPDDNDTTALLERWQRELFGDQGALLDRVKETGRKRA